MKAEIFRKGEVDRVGINKTGDREPGEKIIIIDEEEPPSIERIFQFARATGVVVVRSGQEIITVHLKKEKNVQVVSGNNLIVEDAISTLYGKGLSN
ncbi:MAG: hypothetical protein WC682_02935 [Parcubacteria group bacterium]|jgi:hypothetical protein